MDQQQSREHLQDLLKQKEPTLRAMIWTVEDQIKRFKLPYKVLQSRNSAGELVATLIDVGESTDAWLARFVTVSKEMLQMKEDVKKLAQIGDDPDQLFSVLIVGDTGTGKELIARALHGDREDEFMGINCAGLPSELVESELFGHAQEAFTGASKTKIGLLKAVKRGTVFLDEIGELPMEVQAKLLRAIQSKQIRKVGAITQEKIECRIVCATHRNLREMIEENKFRRDLFARISTFELGLTSLKDRPEDIVPIIKSIENGEELLQKIGENMAAHIDVSMNVRSLQQHIKRYKVLGKMP